MPAKVLNVFEDQQLQRRVFADRVKRVRDFVVASDLLNKIRRRHDLHRIFVSVNKQIAEMRLSTTGRSIDECRLELKRVRIDIPTG